MEQARFNIFEILSLIGMAQCVYVLVYMLFRAGNWRHAVLPFLYFLVLGSAFFFDFAQRALSQGFSFFMLAEWAAWFAGPPLSVMLIVQISRSTQILALRQFWVLLPLPVAALAGFMLARLESVCVGLTQCPPLQAWLIVTGLIAGLISVAALWTRRGLLDGIKAEKAGPERYWLAMTLIFINLLFLTDMLLSLTKFVSLEQALLIRTILGLGGVYLAGSSLFRIYPQAVQMVERRPRPAISGDEKELAQKIERLLALDKIYQEPAYNRADLARELDLPEATVSRIVNTYFGKSFPQVLNERRVNDARNLLAESNLPVKDVAEQVGFNSLASFNRVFREQTGTTPSAYRETNTGK